MIEIETKLRVTAEVAGRLADLVDADAPVRQVDEVFLLKSSSWVEHQAGQPVVRLRVVDNSVTMTVKSAISDHAADEFEVGLSVETLDDARQAIQLMGATLVTRVAKTRRQGTFNGVGIYIDVVDGLGDFVELEVVAPTDADQERAHAAIEEARAVLGLDEWPIETARYDTLLERARTHHRA